ncbi:protoporphyrinogen oxidase HemJ [Polycladidibacter hongkongensis]|uniref:protoporphyrinogen oxidase HemJ n=1 Tax=Polycladidibacter hongkongensis TaxID=1647556 RepID=UPI000832A766|nr:protoporphyrinogen oxidase HemJ [Pseudovibrio hongkongensis]
MEDVYSWVKYLHIISVIAWMAGLFYIPRLFVYHTSAEIGSDKSETFKIMERRLYKAIISPAMVSSYVFGLWTAYELDAFLDPWFHAKMLFVVALTGYQGFIARYLRDFANDANKHSERFYRIFNEVPTLLMLFIVYFVIFKPF